MPLAQRLLGEVYEKPVSFTSAGARFCVIESQKIKTIVLIAVNLSLGVGMGEGRKKIFEIINKIIIIIIKPLFFLSHLAGPRCEHTDPAVDVSVHCRVVGLHDL